MAKFLIEGGNKLKGTIRISGNKNSVLPCIAAALLTDGEVVLKNVPDITDVDRMLDILDYLEIKYEKEKDTLKIKSGGEFSKTSLPSELTSKLRASVLLLGPILAKKGKVQIFHPGGDIIGRRSIDIHLFGLKDLGYKYEIKDREYDVTSSGNFVDEREVFLEEPSVTGTENLIMVSVLGKAKITLKNCATEPHVVDLCKLLIRMGAQIEGVGTSTLEISGVEKLTGAEFEIGPDYIELATYAVASVITDGEIKMDGCSLKDLEPVTYAFRKMGVELLEFNNQLITKFTKIKAVSEYPGLVSRPWPGMPTDLMSVFIVLATQANGVTLLHDWMYESRMFFVDKLINMGANITIADPHRVLVYGPSQLWGRNLETPDIRAGMALVLAALIAKGKSTINRAELMERGYANVLEKLSKLGANITKIA